MPSTIPAGFTFETAHRRITTRENSLYAGWSRGADNLTWQIRTPDEQDILNIVSINEREKYDVSLYPIPWAVSVPDEYFSCFQSPVFMASELTIDAIRARTQGADDGRRGDTSRTSQFGVLFDDVLVVISAGGLTPEQIWVMLFGE
jgi:hypothetical protein